MAQNDSFLTKNQFQPIKKVGVKFCKISGLILAATEFPWKVDINVAGNVFPDGFKNKQSLRHIDHLAYIFPIALVTSEKLVQYTQFCL